MLFQIYIFISYLPQCQLWSKIPKNNYHVQWQHKWKWLYLTESVLVVKSGHLNWEVARDLWLYSIIVKSHDIEEIILIPSNKSYLASWGQKLLSKPKYTNNYGTEIKTLLSVVSMFIYFKS